MKFKRGVSQFPYDPGEKYEPVDTVPEGLTWKPTGRPRNDAVILVSIGRAYILHRLRATGEVKYYKAKDTGPEKSPSEKIDAEPVKKGQDRYRVGTQCWFLDTGDRWYLCEVVRRVGRDRATWGQPHRIVIRSVTGWDADKRNTWDYGEELEFPSKPTNRLFQRLRPLKARYQ